MSDEKNRDELAAYIVEWLRSRNGEQLRPAFDNMRVGDFELMLDELALILQHGGKPPNWTS